MNDVAFVVRSFDALSVRELHDALALRQRVFVVEQACAYQDVDGRDPRALHVLGKLNGELVAYARILTPGERFDVHAIGRVVVAPEARGGGLSRALMRFAIGTIESAHGPVPIALSAQAHLEGLYASLGFHASGAEYDEDGIPHVDMRRG